MGAVGGLDLFPSRPNLRKSSTKPVHNPEHDANRVISEIKAAREDANRGIQKLTETFTREVAMNDQGRRTDDAWKHVNQEHITENSVQHEKMMHIMELVEKNLGHVAEGLPDTPCERKQIESASGQIQEGLHMRWGKMTERGTYTLTEKHKDKLRDIANDTQTSQSKLVRKALDLYFEHLEAQKQGEPPQAGR